MVNTELKPIKTKEDEIKEKENKSKEIDMQSKIDQAVKAAMEKAEKAHKDELQKLKDQLEAQTKYKPQMAPIPDNQMELPEGMRDSQIVTKVRNISSVIEEKMMQLKDLATMEIMLDASVRLKKRLESIKKMGSAENMKINGVWKTIPPQVYISGLVGKRINNDEFEIRFGVYETDEKGNKKLYVNYADVLMHDGSVIKRATSAEYRIAYEVVEKIKSGKPITREIHRIDKIQE